LREGGDFDFVAPVLVASLGFVQGEK